MHSISASLTVPILQSANLSKPPQYEANCKITKYDIVVVIEFHQHKEKLNIAQIPKLCFKGIPNYNTILKSYECRKVCQGVF
jgi:hypothetical protein